MRARYSAMGVGALVLGAIAWAMICVALALRTPHEVASLALVFSISGWAVAHERRRVEPDRSDWPRRFDIWLNLLAISASIVCITMEIARRAHT